MRNRIAVSLLASVFMAVPACHPAAAQTFNQFVGFGDSSADSGWWKAALPSNATGNPNKDTLIANSIALGHSGSPVGAGELMNTQVLASRFGLTAIPANQPGGTNFAISGATTAASAANGFIGNLNPNPNLPSTVQQMANYLAGNGGVANPNALFLVSTGGNDISFANDNPGLFPTLAAKEAFLAGQASLLATELQALQAAGARYIIVHGSQGGGTLPTFMTQAIWSDLAAAHVNFIPSDVHSIIRAAQSDPTRFGFTAATVVIGDTTTSTGSACILQQSGTGPQSGWGQWCVNSTTPSTTHAYLRAANAEQTSLFSDDQHFSAAGQKMEADYDYSLVVAPSLISFLAEVPLKTRTSVITAIRNQIPISESQNGPYGVNGWITGDVSWLKLNNNYNGFPDDPGTPVAVTAGFDIRINSDWLIGAAFSGGTTRQSFSQSFGNFTIIDFSANLYAAYRHGPFWANGILSAGVQNYDVHRSVPIGITVVDNWGKTNGTNLSFAAEGGYQFVTGPWKHGPLAGIIAQQVHVDGFTESDQFASVGGFTALGFGAQRRNSAVSELGYEASFDAGIWRPFAKVAWNHELASLDRQVTAFLTTVTFAPGYSLPAVQLGRDWASAIAGTTLRLSKNVVGYGAFVGQFGQNGATNLGGQIGLNVAFGPAPAADMPVKAPILK